MSPLPQSLIMSNFHDSVCTAQNERTFPLLIPAGDLTPCKYQVCLGCQALMPKQGYMSTKQATANNKSCNHYPGRPGFYSWWRLGDPFNKNCSPECPSAQ